MLLGELAEQIDELLRDIFADRLFVRVAKRVRNVRVMAPSAAFTRSRCSAVAPGCFGCLVRRQAERPPLNIIVKTHFDPVALKTVPREDPSFRHAALTRKRNRPDPWILRGSPAQTVKQKQDMFVPHPG